MKIDTTNDNDNTVKPEEFFKEFSEPREKFADTQEEETENLYFEKGTEEEPEEETEEENFFLDEEESKEENNFFENETIPDAILTLSDKRKSAEEIINLVDDAVDFIGSTYTGTEEVGRYKANKAHKENLINSLTKFIPDTFKGVPKGLELPAIVILAYAPVVKKIRKDKKQQEYNEKVREEAKEDSKNKDKNETDFFE